MDTDNKVSVVPSSVNKECMDNHTMDTECLNLLTINIRRQLVVVQLVLQETHSVGDSALNILALARHNQRRLQALDLETFLDDPQVDYQAKHKDLVSKLVINKPAMKKL
jgi:hypothetical protein